MERAGFSRDMSIYGLKEGLTLGGHGWQTLAVFDSW